MTMEFKVRTWLWLVLALVAVLGGVFTYWYVYGQKSGTATVTTSPTAPTSTKKTSPSPTASSSTADWQTYTNDTYGLSLKYPKNITPEFENDGKSIIFSTDEDKQKYNKCSSANKETECIKEAQLVINVDSTVNTPNGDDLVLTLDQIVQNRVDHTVFAKSPAKITFANQSAYEAINMGMFSSYDIVTKYNNHIYDLTVVQICKEDTLDSCKKEESETTKNMLSTFQFTK